MRKLTLWERIIIRFTYETIEASYHFVEGKRNGFGRMNITTHKRRPISEIEEFIAKEKGLDKVVILSWQPARH